jgi:hypothetical protein
MRSNSILQRCAVGILLTSCVLLGACRGGPSASCAKPGVYTQAESVAPLRIPAGLDAPDTRGALRVPDLNEPEAPRAPDAPCLDQPPKFSNTAKLEAPPAEKKNSKSKSKAAPPPPAAPAAPAPAP